jgi:hypothetical protein
MYDDHGRREKTRTLLVTLAIVGCLLTVGACVLWATWAANRPQTATAGGAVDAAGHETTPRAADAIPHADFALGAEERKVRDWIINNEDDPKSLEFASWGPHDLKGGLWGTVSVKTIRVRYRSKNLLGSLRLHDVLVYISDNGRIRAEDNYGGNDWMEIRDAKIPPPPVLPPLDVEPPEK